MDPSACADGARPAIEHHAGFGLLPDAIDFHCDGYGNAEFEGNRHGIFLFAGLEVHALLVTPGGKKVQRKAKFFCVHISDSLHRKYPRSGIKTPHFFQIMPVHWRPDFQREKTMHLFSARHDHGTPAHDSERPEYPGTRWDRVEAEPFDMTPSRSRHGRRIVRRRKSAIRREGSDIPDGVSRNAGELPKPARFRGRGSDLTVTGNPVRPAKPQNAGSGVPAFSVWHWLFSALSSTSRGLMHREPIGSRPPGNLCAA